jgi:hypothetical protein
LSVRYYDVQKNWRKLKPIVESIEAQQLLRIWFPLFRSGPYDRPDVIAQGRMTVPADHDFCDWRLECHREVPRRGRRPAFWDYVCWSGCHWLVHFNLFLAHNVEQRHWKIRSSNQHSTVWDGDELLFDMNFLALGIPPEEALRLAQTYRPPGEDKCLLTE